LRPDCEHDSPVDHPSLEALENMMASGGYPWTVIPVVDRKTYMETLEKASVGEDIVPFTDFLAGFRESLGMPNVKG